VRLPSVEAVRPATCPACGAASHPVGGVVVLHGHGLRERQLRGVRSPHEPPSLLAVRVRRYACQRCGAVLVVVPVAVGARRLFDLATIAFALARWCGDGVSSRAVRAEVSPLPFVGDSARRAWSQLRRWARRAVEILRPPRMVASDGSVTSARGVLQTVAALAPLSVATRPLAERAFAAMATAK
jgi:transposase